MEKKPSVLRELFNKHREFIMYCIFGVLTTIVGWVTYSLSVLAFRGDSTAYSVVITAIKDGAASEILGTELETFILLANVVSWIVAVVFAFVVNKIWVFSSRSWRPGLVAHEASRFIGGRVLTGILEIVAVPLLVGFGLNQTLFTIEGLPAKIVVSVVIVILNYIISKFYAFKASEPTGE